MSRVPIQHQPTPADSFVGRVLELRRLRALVQGGERLITLQGPAGVGKSRLAWELVQRIRTEPWFRADLLFCPLHEPRDPDDLLRRLAASLGLDVAAAPSRAVAEAVREDLVRRARALVVLDDLDPIGAATATLLGRWLETAPGVTFLVTTRESLHLPGEVIVPVEPLSIDEGLELLRLRAASAGADPAEAEPGVLRAIATALDGLPLALELAAAQLAHLPARLLLERLPARLELLVRSPDAPGFNRYATLRDAIEASWRILEPHEKDALAQASVFRGGFDGEAARAVIRIGEGHDVDATIRSLCERSLLQKRCGAADRFQLDTSIRTFAERQLEPGQRAAVERRHADHYLELAERWARALDKETDREAALALEREQENLLAILHRSVDRSSAPEGVAAGLRAAIALAPLYLLRQHADELIRLLDELFAAASPSRTDPKLRARALWARGCARLAAGKPAGALADLQESAALARTLGDPGLESQALLVLARIHREQGRDRECARLCEQAIDLLEASGDELALGRALASRGMLAAERGEHEEAQRWLERAMEIATRAADRRSVAVIEGRLGNLLRDRGRIEEALQHMQAALALFQELGDARNEAAVLANLGTLHLEAGRPAQARACYDRALAMLQKGRSRRVEALVIGSRAAAFHEEGRLDEAYEGYVDALRRLRELGDRRNQGLVLLEIAVLLVERGEREEAERHVERAVRFLGNELGPAIAAALEAGHAALALARVREEEHDRRPFLLEEARSHLHAARSGGAADYDEGRVLLRLVGRLLAAAEREGGR